MFKVTTLRLGMPPEFRFEFEIISGQISKT